MITSRWHRLAWLGLAFLAAACRSPDAAVVVGRDTSIEGRWYGTAGFPEDRVPIGFDIRRVAGGARKVFLYQPVINFYGLELPGELADSAGHYRLTGLNLELTRRDSLLVGTYLHLNTPIALHRVARLPEEVPVPRLPAGPLPRWKTRLGSAIYASAAVYGGIGYVGTSGGIVSAIALRDGAFVWTFAAGRPVFGAPLVNATHVFFVCDNGWLFKLDRLTGAEVWRYDLGDARVSRVLPHQVIDHSGDFDWDTRAPTPVLADGVLFVGAGDGGLHAVDAETGRRRWRFAATGKLRTEALVAGDRVIVGSWSDTLYAVGRRDGRLLWKRGTGGPVTGAPALIGGRIVVGNRNGALTAVDPASGERRWRMLFWGSAVESSPAAGDSGLFYIGSSDLRRISLIDSHDGRVVWRADVFGWAWARPLVHGRTLYVTTVGADPYEIRHLGALTALDRVSGAMRWRWAAPTASGTWLSGFAAAPVLADSLLVVGGLDGTLYGFPVN